MKEDTLVTHVGRRPMDFHGAVNTPVFRCSTVLYPNTTAYRERMNHRYDRMTYGLAGTPSTFTFEEAMAALEGGYRCVAVPSGLVAVTAALMAFLEAGDHVLMVDSTYGPTRKFCDGLLKRQGVTTTYYDPLIGAGIADLMRPETKVVFCESPGSQTFEVQDIPAIAQAAHARGAKVLLDNSWATPVFFKAFRHGVDVSIHACTKYVGGHSDVLLGAITAAGEDDWRRVRDAVSELGICPGSEEVYLGTRGLRTLTVRLRHQQEAGLKVARWLAARPEVARVLHPALPEDPGHALWQRDFEGASSLFGVVLNPYPDAAVVAMLDGIKLFGMGSSWGGYESLLIPTTPEVLRTATRWEGPGPSLRIHVGLEDTDDLIADLEAGLRRLAAA